MDRARILGSDEANDHDWFFAYWKAWVSCPEAGLVLRVPSEDSPNDSKDEDMVGLSGIEGLRLLRALPQTNALIHQHG